MAIHGLNPKNMTSYRNHYLRDTPEQLKDFLKRRSEYMKQYRIKKGSEYQKIESKKRVNWRRNKLIKKAGRPKLGQCEVCEIIGEMLYFDHDHKTGKFRGWLCGNCNRALGQAKDSPEVLRKLAIYLEVCRAMD